MSPEPSETLKEAQHLQVFGRMSHGGAASGSCTVAQRIFVLLYKRNTKRQKHEKTLTKIELIEKKIL